MFSKALKIPWLLNYRFEIFPISFNPLLRTKIVFKGKYPHLPFREKNYAALKAYKIYETQPICMLMDILKRLFCPLFKYAYNIH